MIFLLRGLEKTLIFGEKWWKEEKKSVFHVGRCSPDEGNGSGRPGGGMEKGASLETVTGLLSTPSLRLAHGTCGLSARQVGALCWCLFLAWGFNWTRPTGLDRLDWT